MTARLKRQKLAVEPEWSAYQLAVFDWIKNGSGHAQIEAVAGSGKSTSLLGIVNRIPCSRQPTAVLAFNRHVAEELRSYLGDRSGLTVSTCHSMGLSVLRRYFSGIEIKPNERKYHEICKRLMETFPLIDKKDQESKHLTHEIFDFLKEVVRYSHLTLTDPRENTLMEMVKHFSLDLPSSDEYMRWALSKVPLALEIGEKLAADHLDISLDDLIWLPNRWDIKVPQKAFVLWDEAQDANKSMLELCLRAVRDGGRLVAIGDPAQAIMGFAGSDADSWQHIQKNLQPTILPLSVCYRCPTSHLDLARRIVPQIEPRPGAIPGETATITQQDAFKIINSGDMVICRLTAPLIKLCLGLVIDGKKAFVRGRDLGKDLTSLVKKATQIGDYPDRFISVLNEYCSPKIAFLKQNGEERKAESLEDRRDAVQTCFLSFGKERSNRDDFCTRIESLFSDDVGECILLSTIHRAKGLEADTVFILKSDLLPYIHKADQEWQQRQEINLTYVALTRAKQKLYFIPSSSSLLSEPLGGIELIELVKSQDPLVLGQIEQIATTAPDGWFTIEGVYISRDDLVNGRYSVVPPVVPVQTSIEDGFLILTEFSADIDCYEMLRDLTHHWTAKYKREVWNLLPLELRQKYQDLKRTTLAPATDAPQLVKKPAEGTLDEYL